MATPSKPAEAGSSGSNTNTNTNTDAGGEAQIMPKQSINRPHSTRNCDYRFTVNTERTYCHYVGNNMGYTGAKAHSVVSHGKPKKKKVILHYTDIMAMCCRVIAPFLFWQFTVV